MKTPLGTIGRPVRRGLAALSLSAYVAFSGVAAFAATQPEALMFEFGPMGRINDGTLKLSGADAVRQLNVALKYPNSDPVDVTRTVELTAQPDGIVAIDGTGRVSVKGDGSGTIRAKDAKSGLQAELKFLVEKAKEAAPINFTNRIVPVFTKGSCNSGGRHGKSGGQNGFRLSLLGFEPEEDYEHLVKEARGRRLFPASPENSLLLTKGVGSSPHGGGKRMSVDSDDYRLVVRWIQQGMPFGNPTDPKLAEIEGDGDEGESAVVGASEVHGRECGRCHAECVV